MLAKLSVYARAYYYSYYFAFASHPGSGPSLHARLEGTT